MHHRMPSLKTGWHNLSVVIFPPVLRLVLDDKNSDHPGNYWSNSQANLGRPPDFGEINSWASERVGSIMHEDLDMRKLFAKWVPKCLNADQKRQLWQSSEQRLNFFWRDPNDFLSRLVTMDETWLFHYDPETKKQSMEWRNSDLPRPKIFRVQKSAGKFSPRFFFGSRQHLPHWISSKGPSYHGAVLRISAGAIEGHFEGKTPREVHQGGVVLARQCPGSPGTCNPKETGLHGSPMSWSPTLFSGSGPVGLPTVPWTEKNNL